MRLASKTWFLVALAALFLVPTAVAQTAGTCNLGAATKDLDGNNVRARLYNNGGLFWKGSGNVYTVPKNGEANAIFASGIWIGGLDSDGEIRFAGTAYGPFEYYPGPLGAGGAPPADCSVYDRIYKVTRSDLNNYELNGVTTADMVAWPYQLGAPVIDGDGDPFNYDLAGGDRPNVIGEQTAWWVMNDVGGTKGWSVTQPIGMEVQVTAFAFNTSDALNNTTFYKYKLIHKGTEPLDQTYFGIWSDPDLGNAADDYVGSDTTLGLGIVYNGQDVDQGADGYGIPPALAYDFFQGPLVPAPGETFTDPDGAVHVDSTRLPMTIFLYYNNDSTPYGNPTGSTDDPYDYLRGIWRDGTPMTFGGNGYGGTVPTNFMFPGNPVTRSFWSEENTDGRGSRNTPADRRFLMSTGPFDLKPGDVQEIVYGIVWSQSVNRLASVAQLKFDDILAQGAFNSNFNIPPPPAKPVVTAQALDRAVILEWTNDRNSNNFLNQYDEPSAFLVDQNPPDGDVTFTFEGYRIFQYESPFDQSGRVVGTLDVKNQVTTVTDDAIDLETGAVVTGVTANGGDVGVKNYYAIENLTNFKEYYFGVQAYAYNGNSAPKIYAGPIERVTVIPAPVANRNGGTVVAEGVEAGSVVASVRSAGVGDTGGVLAKVVNPAGVTGNAYEVRVYNVDVDDEEVMTFDLVNANTSADIINGTNYLARTGTPPPFGEDLIVADGLSFSVSTAPPAIKEFTVVANGGGALDPPEIGNFAFNSNGFPFFMGHDRPAARQQVGGGLWGIHTGETNGDKYDDFVRRSIADGWDIVVPYDYEIRFTERCRGPWETAYNSGDPYGNYPTDACYAIDYFGYVGSNHPPVIVPFEFWNIGAGTPDDTADDFRMLPWAIDWDGDGFNLQCFDHEVSGGNNDPALDWFYASLPAGDDMTPGEAGYEAFVAGLLSEADGRNAPRGSRVLARLTIVNWNGGTIDASCEPGRALDTGIFTSEMPEVGTVFRMVTSKPLAAGDVYSINTASFAPSTGVLDGADDDAKQAALDLIGIVPNPYKGASAYEVDLTADKVRFTNLPQEATIRVFTLAGTLIKTFIKNSGATSLEWDLETEEQLPIASGMYLIHVEVPGVGEKVIKFGVIKKRVQLDLF